MVCRVDLTPPALHADADRHPAVRRQGLLIDRVQMVGTRVIAADAVERIERFEAVDPDDAVIDQRDVGWPTAVERLAGRRQNTIERPTESRRDRLDPRLDAIEELLAGDEHGAPRAAPRCASPAPVKKSTTRLKWRGCDRVRAVPIGSAMLTIRRPGMAEDEPRQQPADRPRQPLLDDFLVEIGGENDDIGSGRLDPHRDLKDVAIAPLAARHPRIQQFEFRREIAKTGAKRLMTRRLHGKRRRAEAAGPKPAERRQLDLVVQ